jgi:hypothetical protein
VIGHGSRRLDAWAARADGAPPMLLTLLDEADVRSALAAGDRGGRGPSRRARLWQALVARRSAERGGDPDRRVVATRSR